ncbi:GDSL-type esterase/lipase family protein [Algivirga pacifica]|uniref:GDSL-type esterase/lipase family protein n=1 Tax=Algivirga pacifica TaxID=1162670 RepID=A0ABP9DLA5_9BACT
MRENCHQKRKRKWKGLLMVPLVCLLGAAKIPFNGGDPEGESTAKRTRSDYDFIRLDINYLQHFSYSEGLSHFFTQLKLLEERKDRKVHVLHLGDSHIQADFFSGKVREEFYKDKRFPMSGRGFVFPYRLAKTNNPLNYSVSYTGAWRGQRCSMSRHQSRWGVAGVSAETNSSSATVEINPNVQEEMMYDISSVSVFHPHQETTEMRINVIPDEGNTISVEEPTRGVETFRLQNPQQAVKLSVSKDAAAQSRLLMQGVFLESDRPGIIYSAAGVNGAKAKSFERCADMGPQINFLKPDLIIVSLGTNDAIVKPFNRERFIDHYTNLLDMIKKEAPQASIILTTPGDNYRQRKYLNYDNEEARLLIGELAMKYNASVWDFYTIMGGLNSINDWYANGLAARDMVHLSREGYEYQGDLFYRALTDAYTHFKDSVSQYTIDQYAQPVVN